MSEVTEQVLLARPVKDKTAHSTEKNMFASLRSSERLPSLSKIKGK